MESTLASEPQSQREINGDLKYCHSIFPVLNSSNEDNVKLHRLSPWLCVLWRCPVAPHCMVTIPP